MGLSCCGVAGHCAWAAQLMQKGLSKGCGSRLARAGPSTGSSGRSTGAARRWHAGTRQWRRPGTHLGGGGLGGGSEGGVAEGEDGSTVLEADGDLVGLGGSGLQTVWVGGRVAAAAAAAHVQTCERTYNIDQVGGLATGQPGNGPGRPGK